MCDHSLYSRYILYLQYSCICMTDYDPLAKRCARVRVCMLLAMELVEGIQKSPVLVGMRQSQRCILDELGG